MVLFEMIPVPVLVPVKNIQPYTLGRQCILYEEIYKAANGKICKALFITMAEMQQ